MVKLLGIVLILWVGSVLGVSFIAAPTKFMASHLTMPVALEVGKVTFHVFNKVEWAKPFLGEISSDVLTSTHKTGSSSMTTSIYGCYGLYSQKVKTIREFIPVWSFKYTPHSGNKIYGVHDFSHKPCADSFGATKYPLTFKKMRV
jgi:uncharacterized membrane protein